MRAQAVLPPEGLSPAPMGMAWSPDGLLIAGSGIRPGPHVWDVTDLKRISLTAHGSFCFPVVWDRTGTNLISGTANGEILEIDYRAERIIRSVQAFEHDVRDIAISPDGDFIAAGSQEGQLWIGRSHDLSTVAAVSAHVDAVRSVAWAPSGEWVATGGGDSRVQVWNLQGQSIGGLAHHTNSVTRVAFSPNGRLLASSSYDGSIRFWDLNEQREALALESFEGWWVLDFVFSHDAKLVASLDQDPQLAVWRLADGAMLYRERVPFGTDRLALHPAEFIVGCAGAAAGTQAWRFTNSTDDLELDPPVSNSESTQEITPATPPELMDADERFLHGMLLAARDPASGQPHVEAAAESGHVDAMLIAGSIAEDLEESNRAERWYGEAARHGNSRAMFALGRLALERVTPQPLSLGSFRPRKSSTPIAAATPVGRPLGGTRRLQLDGELGTAGRRRRRCRFPSAARCHRLQT